MNFFKDKTLDPVTWIQINSDNFNEDKYEQTGLLWDYYWNRYFQVKFQILRTKKKVIKYSTNNGINLRVDTQKDLLYPLNNLEQIKYLKWLEIQNPNLNQSERWILIWKGQALADIGGEYSNGSKQGPWKEPIENYWTLSQVYYIGNYLDGERIGIWKYIYEDQLIGGGIYDNKNIKNGKWIELSENFSNNANITYSGEYKNNKKVDKWEIKYRFSCVYQLECIGGGSYNQEGIKNGLWIDLIDNFYRYNSNFNQFQYLSLRQVTFNGEYQNGKKVGRWDTYFRIESLFQSQFQLIGGGSYDETGIKNGNWIEPSNNFYKYSQVTYEGEYQNGKKINQWVTRYKQKDQLDFICGGEYDAVGSIKKGFWVELSDEFRQDNQIVYQGIYHNGKKIGRWDINFRELDQFEKIGVCYYDEQFNKIGFQKEISESFFNLSQVIYIGEYQDGQKTGQWKIYWKNNLKIEELGSGLYGENGLKKGNWIELAIDFNEDKQVTYYGEYHYGQKVGLWVTYFRFSVNFEEIGCGCYDDEGIQNGFWIELDEDFSGSKQIIYKGQYKNGKKFEKWQEFKRDKWKIDQGFQKIGETYYQN
ncbi:unnamed protein product [Paramecium octaurelia]|uniref:Uncharacterized protein n=1 Tax=Paramecium octaurelia TaxID=43137 RepID=A0A8S1V847_PAROT|nr:unnamed protein product [Paramecium octaurelia]